MTEEESEIIKQYHKYVIELCESNNMNYSLIKPEKFNFKDEMCCQWLVLTVLSLQDKIRRK